MHILVRVLLFGWHASLDGRLVPAKSVDQKCDDCHWGTQGGQ